MITISQKIVGYSVARKDDLYAERAAQALAEQASAATPVVDYDPSAESLDGAPMGTFDAKRYGAEYHHPQQGRQTLFVAMSTFPAKGLIAGDEVIADRAFEMFVPGGQRQDIQPWITVTMKLASLLQQQGVPLSRILKRFDCPGSDHIPFALPNGKKRFFSSEVQVVGQAFKNLAASMGLMDEEGNDIPYMKRARPVAAPVVVTGSGATETKPESPRSVGAMEVSIPERDNGLAERSVGTCPDCGGNLIPLDNCPTCAEGCGWSKCG